MTASEVSAAFETCRKGGAADLQAAKKIVMHMNLFDQVNRRFSEDRSPIPGPGERRARDNIQALILEIHNGNSSIKPKFTPQYNPDLLDDDAASFYRKRKKKGINLSGVRTIKSASKNDITGHAEIPPIHTSSTSFYAFRNRPLVGVVQVSQPLPARPAATLATTQPTAAVEADRADGRAANELPPAVHILPDASVERSSRKLEEATGKVRRCSVDLYAGCMLRVSLELCSQTYPFSSEP
ncbi:hypothetical protein MAPG_10214 [Magnaporthiopsis poae ATCC 64411]|uniref:Uncharacterized protein n=1 Tax=Magnaporthiopsis poae (strain ATCC 64411 / 73-15) TaxID=644358 RepID=A0A0C4EC02_MAGP6|nr:hypothetical protein MAPG_10214 [Magnaporthiopsis poae ATCC 64411]